MRFVNLNTGQLVVSIPTAVTSTKLPSDNRFLKGEFHGEIIQ